jgi:hypothetical protein
MSTARRATAAAVESRRRAHRCRCVGVLSAPPGGIHAVGINLHG